MPGVLEALALVPELEIEPVRSSCCGMAGAFGYDARYVEASLAMAEADLLPAVRDADDETVIVADGTSCRHQILDGAAREARHVASLLAESVAA
jgi:Fe-S oxidoreductase